MTREPIFGGGTAPVLKTRVTYWVKKGGACTRVATPSLNDIAPAGVTVLDFRPFWGSHLGDNWPSYIFTGHYWPTFFLFF
jgi:hypothetical protein